MRVRLLALAMVWLTGFPLAAQVPRLGYVYPPGARAGETVEVTLGGYDLTADVDYFLHDARAKMKVSGSLTEMLVPGPPYWFGGKSRSSALPLPREITATISLPADLPRGPIHWQVANVMGSSGMAVFYVGDGHEVLESRRRDEPQQLASLPVTVNGRLERITEVDRYSFNAGADGPVTIDLFARRLGADFHGSLQVRDDRGRLLADVADTRGRDCATTVAVQKGHRYEVGVFDLDFRGNRAFVYRLEFTPGPRVVACLPSGGQPGTTAEVTLVGFGLKTGAAKLESLSRRITFPGIVNDQRWFLHRVKTAHGQTPPFVLLLDDLAETVEPKKDQPGLPTTSAVTATLATAGETDVYLLDAKAGRSIRLEVRSEQIGTRLDPVLRVLDDKQKQLAINDDLPGTLDSGLDFKPPADGVYRVLVSNGSGHDGTADAVYRLTARIPDPGFSLTVPVGFSVPVGGKATLNVTAKRSGGFADEIALAMTGLPNGVTVSKPVKIAKGKAAAKIELAVAKTSGTAAVFVGVTGTAAINGQPVTVTARSVRGGDLAPRDAAAHLGRRLLLSRTLTPPIKLELIDRNRQRAVHRGTTYPAEFLVKRDQGYTGVVRLRMAAKQGRHRQGINAPIFPVPPRTELVHYPCFMPEWLETDRTTRMVIHAVAEIKDATGRVRHTVKAANASVTMILEGALMKLSHQAGELTVKSGSRFQVPVRVVRSAKFREDAVIRLEVPEELKGLLQAEPVKLAAGKSEAVLEITTLPDARLAGDWDLKITATAMQDGRWPAVSQTRVAVRLVR